MKILQQLAFLVFVLIQTMGYSQEINTEVISKEQDTIAKKQQMNIEINNENFGDFIGTYWLEEGGFELKIIQENGSMYIVSPFSTDILTRLNETTLHEPTRGVDLALIENNADALKFTQNGYETTIKRVDIKVEK